MRLSYRNNMILNIYYKYVFKIVIITNNNCFEELV